MTKPGATVSPNAASSSAEGIHVLVVDDEPVIREEIVEYLQLQGIPSEAVSNGLDALERLAADTSITVMLSDIRMPEMNGLTLAATAITRCGEQNAIEVVMLTGHATVNDAAASTRLRAIDFLVKPLSFVTLKASLTRAHESAIARRHAWRQTSSLQTMYGDTVRQVGELQSLVGKLQAGLSGTKAAEPGKDGGRGAFMAVVSHELRTPLVPIIGLAEIIEQTPGGLNPAELKSLAREIRQGGERLERALSRITRLTDLIANRIKPQPGPCRPETILRGIERSFDERLAVKRQTLAIRVETSRNMNIDVLSLTQLLSELVDNANRFAAIGASITVTVEDDDDGVAFAVTDTGPGMTRDEIELASQMFQQVDMSMSRPVDGLGIGLPIAIRFAALLGGKLAVESEPDRGTTVRLHLPATCVLTPDP